MGFLFYCLSAVKSFLPQRFLKVTAEVGPSFARSDLDVVLVVLGNFSSEAFSLVLSLFCSCYFTELQAYSICTKTKSLLEKACCYKERTY